MKKKSLICIFPAMAAFGAVAFSVPTFADNTFYFNEAGYDSDQPISIVVRSTDNLEGAKWTLWFDPDGGTTGASNSGNEPYSEFYGLRAVSTTPLNWRTSLRIRAASMWR